jgi:hypothetical protein
MCGKSVLITKSRQHTQTLDGVEGLIEPLISLQIRILVVLAFEPIKHGDTQNNGTVTETPRYITMLDTSPCSE